MTDKLHVAREYVLNQIETGVLRGGDKLPAAREYADQVGVSLAITQMAFNSLGRDGILHSVPRQGTYVRTDWRDRILPCSIHTFRPVWKDVVSDLIPGEVPDLRLCDGFSHGVYEILPSLDAFSRQDDYLDLSDYFAQACPDRDEFFTAYFRAFHGLSGKLYGIPLIFSPWVMRYNADMVAASGGQAPRTGWTWDDFIALVRRLRTKYPAERVIDAVHFRAHWSGLLMRSGGVVLERSESGRYRVTLDSPQMLAGLRRLRELVDALDYPPAAAEGPIALPSFERGELALRISSREDCVTSWEDGARSWENLPVFDKFAWGLAPMPTVPGGADCSRLACDVLCVRRQVNDFAQVVKVIRLLLSPEVQNRVGRARYGIPIRRSAAIRSYMEEDARDRIFFAEMPKIVPDHGLAWPEVYRLFYAGVERILRGRATPEAVVGELTPVFKVMVSYREEGREAAHDWAKKSGKFTGPAARRSRGSGMENPQAVETREAQPH